MCRCRDGRRCPARRPAPPRRPGAPPRRPRRCSGSTSRRTRPWSRGGPAAGTARRPPLTAADQVGRGQRRSTARPDRGPASRADQRHRVVAEQPGPAWTAGGVRSGSPPSSPGVGNTYGTTRSRPYPPAARPPTTRPRSSPGARPAPASCTARSTVSSCRRAGTDRRPGRRQRVEQRPAPLGRHLGARLRTPSQISPRGLMPQAVPLQTTTGPAGSHVPSPSVRRSLAMPSRVLILGSAIGLLPSGPTASVLDVPGVGWAMPRSGGTSRRRRPAAGSPGPASPSSTSAATCSPRRSRPAGAVLNGAGECTGLHDRAEWGLAETPVFLTSTMQVGRVYDAACELLLAEEPAIGVDDVIIPVVAECDDSFLYDTRPDAGRARTTSGRAGRRARRGRRSGAPSEGAVGAGTGMSCLGYKGGIGTASRVLPDGHTVGVLAADQFRRARRGSPSTACRSGRLLPLAPAAAHGATRAARRPDRASVVASPTARSTPPPAAGWPGGRPGPGPDRQHRPPRQRRDLPGAGHRPARAARRPRRRRAPGHRPRRSTRSSPRWSRPPRRR